jgi:hypothetical protein
MLEILAITVGVVVVAGLLLALIWHLLGVY